MKIAQPTTISEQTGRELIDSPQYCVDAIRAVGPPLKVHDTDYLNELIDLVDDVRAKLGRRKTSTLTRRAAIKSSAARSGSSAIRSPAARIGRPGGEGSARRTG